LDCIFPKFSICAHKKAAIISEGRKDEPVSTHPYLFTSPLKNSALLVPFSQIISDRLIKR